jgi:hypothetical protein
MKKIYNTQFFRLFISTGIDLSQASSLKIIYKSPDKTSGEWPATIDPTDNTRMFYDSSALVKSGKWVIYAKATFSQGTISGDVANIIVVEEGK